MKYLDMQQKFEPKFAAVQKIHVGQKKKTCRPLEYTNLRFIKKKETRGKQAPITWLKEGSQGWFAMTNQA